MKYKRADIAFAVAILAIGYDFLPIEAPEPAKWAAAIILLGIGGWIVISAIHQQLSKSRR